MDPLSINIKPENSVKKINRAESPYTPQPHISRLMRKTQSKRDLKNKTVRIIKQSSGDLSVRRASEVAVKTLKIENQNQDLLSLEFFLQNSQNKKDRYDYFTKIIQSGPEGTAEKLYEILSDPEVPHSFERLLYEVVSTELALQRPYTDRKEMQGSLLREGSLSVSLLQRRVLPHLKKLYPAIDKACLDALKGAKRRKPEKRVATALDKMLKALQSEVEKGAHKEMRPVYKKFYEACFNAFKDKGLAREQVVGMFFFRSLCRHLYTSDYGEQRPDMVMVGKILNWTSLEIGRDYEKIPDNYHSLFAGKSYEDRKDVIRDIIQRLAIPSK